MRRKRRAVRLSRSQTLIGLVGIVVIIIVAAVLIKKYTPSNVKADINQYFGITTEDEVGLVIGNQKLEAKGKIIDGRVYVDSETVKEHLNSRFYFDSYENVLLYALPKEMVTVEVGKKEYSVAKTTYAENYVIVKAEPDKAYIALDFVQKYTNMEYTLFENPNHVLVSNTWGTLECGTIKKNSKVRVRGGIKSEILTEVPKGTEVIILEDEDGWKKVQTPDGFVGYVKENALNNIRQEEKTREFDEPVYTSIKKDYTINMAWHQIFSATNNKSFLNNIAQTKGVNTISPTWFALKDNEGNISSLADESYVNYAHQLGMEVWGMISNLSEGVDTHEVLKLTSRREKLTNQLIAKAIQYDLDGINVDFEELKVETGEAFIQFLRELSIKCRNNGIVLSVDNYPSAPYNLFYNRTEQGVVADYLIIMGYDEHYNGLGKAGSVASIGYVSNAITEMLKEAPADKVILGIPFYTRLWEESEEGVKGTAVGMDSARNYLTVNGVTPEWDETCAQYYGQYEKNGKTYKIWLEEAESIEEKLKLVKNNNLAGVAAWKLGLENSSIWDTILKYVN